ncbi:MAG: T9SS type A sorting domain-containing protein, partial [Bacteroidales bacterium]|nr:T9SS type A sorting domain-containing protein [Bacteroidales bacterium]
KVYTFDTTLTPRRNNVTYDQTEYPATKSLSLVAKAANVNTDVRPNDCQGGRFFNRTNTLGNVSIYVVDENNIGRFRNGDMSANAEYYFGNLREGQFDVPLHSTGKTYVVLANNNNFTNYVELSYGYELKEGAQFDFLGLQNAEDAEFTVYPNPASDKIVVSLGNNNNGNTHVEVIDMSGRKVAEQNVVEGTAEINISDLQKGVYIVKCGGSVRKIVKK